MQIRITIGTELMSLKGLKMVKFLTQKVENCVDKKRLVGIENEGMTCYQKAVSEVDADYQHNRERKGEPDYPVESVNI